MTKTSITLYGLVLLMIFAGLFFISVDKPVVIDYDEGVYAEVSREMYVSGNMVIPTLNGTGFFEKPPMLYWAQMLGYRLFGINAMGARFVNTAAALATILIFYFGAARPLGSRVAFTSSLILGSSIIFIYLARVAMTDMLLTLFLVSCLVFSWQGVERWLIDRSGAALFWLGCFCAALAMLSKGAIGALLPVLTAICYLVSIGRPAVIFNLRWFIPGTAILVLAGFSWYVMLGIVHPDGFSFMKELFVKHHLGRFSRAMEGHSGPPFYYLIVLFVGFMPWFGYLPSALLGMPLKTADNPGARFIRLFAVFSIIVFIFFSIAATKLPNYILPALPGFALLIGRLFDTRETGGQGHGTASLGWKLSGWAGIIPTILLGLVLLALPFLFPYLAELIGENAYKVPALLEPVQLGYVPYLAAALFFLSAAMQIKAVRSASGKLFETLVLCSLINGCALFFLVIPLYDEVMDAPLARLAEEAAELSPAGGAIVMYEIDDRPSVNFVSGLVTIEHDERDLDELPALFGRPDIEVGLTTNFYFERMQNRGLAPTEIRRDTGFVLFRLVPPPPLQSSGS